jgi:hypothetical protein
MKKAARLETTDPETQQACDAKKEDGQNSFEWNSYKLIA